MPRAHFPLSLPHLLSRLFILIPSTSQDFLPVDLAIPSTLTFSIKALSLTAQVQAYQ